MKYATNCQKASTLKFSACALAVLAAVSISTAATAESVDLTITGQIVPAACTPTLGGGGVVDYGNILASTLSPTAYTVLSVKQVPFSITCTALAKIAIRAVNNRPGTLAGATEVGPQNVANSPVPLLGASPVRSAGLGLDGATPIGGYAVITSPGTFTADTGSGAVSVDSIRQNSDNDQTNPLAWTFDAAGANFYTINPGVSRRITWAVAGTTAPVPFTTLNGMLDVQAYLNNTTALDTSHAIHLDGSATIEIIYM